LLFLSPKVESPLPLQNSLKNLKLTYPQLNGIFIFTFLPKNNSWRIRAANQLFNGVKFMKKLSIMMFVLFSLFHVSAYALQGHGYRIISETIESSPGAKGGFAQIDKNVNNITRNMAFAWSQAYDAVSRVNENTVLKGNHSFNVTNNTKQKQTYTYKYELNCDGQYFRKTDRIEVQPGGVVSDAANSYLTTSHRSSGFFRVNAVTDVSGESSHNHVGTATLRVIG
jgi:hypothetical protein